ncbi:MAG: hypothetical protein ACR2FH_07820 [Caulobacteraceae bacterium]
MKSLMYYVKRDVGLFRKGSWDVIFDRLKIGRYPDRETAVAAAVGEAERTSFLGRTTEVWVYEGDGFILHKAFKKTKRKDDDEGGDDGPDTDELDSVLALDG